MDKDEILRKAQKDRNGEYEEKTYSRILNGSVFVVVGLCVFFWLSKNIHADLMGLEQVSAFEFPAILMGYASFVYLGTFMKLKSKWHLVCGIFFTIGFVIFLVQYFLHL